MVTLRHLSLLRFMPMTRHRLLIRLGLGVTLLFAVVSVVGSLIQDLAYLVRTREWTRTDTRRRPIPDGNVCWSEPTPEHSS